jgi:preprotein translocase subunit YajC
MNFLQSTGLSMDSPALAQVAGGGGDILGFLIPMAAMFGIFWLLVFRPQQKRAKELQDLINSVRRGDIVVTSGGIIGKVTKVGSDNEVRVEIADGVQVRILKTAISDVRGKGEPVREKARAESSAGKDEDASPPGG